MKTVESGFWSGILATGPMTLAMFRMHRALPENQKSPLHPAIVTDELVNQVGPSRAISARQRENLTLLSHLGYGAACGVLYALFDRLTAQKKPSRHPVVKGCAFGTGVWAASYLGWIPAFGLRPAAKNSTPQRNALIVAAHLVWGGAMGYAFNEVRLRDGELLDGIRKAPAAE